MFYTVNQVTTYLRESFESDILLSDLYVSGEISNLRRSASGHAYFTLKDDLALLNCVMFRGQQGSDVLEDGAAVSTPGQVSRNQMQIPVLLGAIEEFQFDCCLGGALRVEEKARAKERFFSFRDAFGQWDPKNQRPEIWNL